MAKVNKIRTHFRLVFKSVMLGSMVMSRVFASPAPIAPNHDALVNDWRNLGDQMSGNTSDLAVLSDHLVDMIAAADLRKNLAEVVAASYEMVDHYQVSALDAHWAGVLTSTNDAELVAEYLNLRASFDFSNFAENQNDGLVWLAQGNGEGGGGCDNGFGNGDQGAPTEQSDDGNAAENDDELGNSEGRCNAGQGGGGSPTCKGEG